MKNVLPAISGEITSFLMSLFSFIGFSYGAVEITSLSLVDTVYAAKFIGVFRKPRRTRTLFARH